MKAKQTNNGAGRPAGTDSERVKSELLHAARQHFLKNEFKAVSVRQIAESAGVNGAMVSYYFGNKQGLYLAMVEELMVSLQSSLSELGEDHELTVTDFCESYMRILAANPWWPNFLIREVLFGEGEMREATIKRFASSFAPRLMASINKEITAGRYRSDLDPALTVVSLMGMTVFPFLARPMVESVFKLSINAELVEVLAQHNIALFNQGALSQGAETSATSSLTTSGDQS